MEPKKLWVVAVALTATAFAIAQVGAQQGFAQTPAEDEIAFGMGIAKRYCGECHGMGQEKSPFADAPRFGDLYKRYRAGGLDELLSEGMLTPDPSMEEGNMPGHPRMPQRRLDVDQRAALKAYLRSLEPLSTDPLI